MLQPVFLPGSDTICHAGTKGKGGQCDCSAVKGWVEGALNPWMHPYCYEGKCYTTQPYWGCVGALNGVSLGDGTWCFNEDRAAECKTETGITGSVLNTRCLKQYQNCVTCISDFF